MSRRFLIALLLVVFCISPVFAINHPISIRGDSDDSYILVRNTSGVTLTHGMVLVWAIAETSQLGYAVTTTTSDDSEIVAGCVPDSASAFKLNTAVADDEYFSMQIRGINADVPVLATDDVTAGQSVGTAGAAGECGDGDGLGFCWVGRSGVRATIYINPIPGRASP